MLIDTIIEIKMVQYQDDVSVIRHSRVFPKIGDMVIVAVEAAGPEFSPAVAYGKVVDIKDRTLAIDPYKKIGSWSPHSTSSDVLWVTNSEVVEIIK